MDRKVLSTTTTFPTTTGIALCPVGLWPQVKHYTQYLRFSSGLSLETFTVSFPRNLTTFKENLVNTRWKSYEIVICTCSRTWKRKQAANPTKRRCKTIFCFKFLCFWCSIVTGVRCHSGWSLPKVFFALDETLFLQTTTKQEHSKFDDLQREIQQIFKDWQNEKRLWPKITKNHHQSSILNDLHYWPFLTSKWPPNPNLTLSLIDIIWGWPSFSYLYIFSVWALLGP